MKCTTCKQGVTSIDQVAVMLERGDSVIVVKGVPAEVCQNCGEYFLSESDSAELLHRAEVAIRSGAELQVLRWVA